MRDVVFTRVAVRQFRRLPKEARPIILEGIRVHLVEADPTETTRNKFRLRRPSDHADFELRIDRWRVFYRTFADTVVIVLIGSKEGNCLLIEGEEFLL